jgi:hypothetical protein
MQIFWDEIFDASHKILDAVKQIITTLTKDETED